VSGKPKKKKKKAESAEPDPGTEDLESLAEEASEGALAPNPELEAALREAADAIPEPGERAPADDGMGEDEGRDEIEVEGKNDDPESLIAEIQESGERELRLRADFDNFRKRALRERQEAIQFGSQNLVKDLLSVVDNLDRAIGHAQQSEGGDLQSLLQGVELVQRELLLVLAKHHVLEIDAMGKDFNPALHEAMAQVPSGVAEPNSVVEVLEKGYQLHDRLIRPSRVVVAREPDEKPESGGEESGEAAD